MCHWSFGVTLPPVMYKHGNKQWILYALRTDGIRDKIIGEPRWRESERKKESMNKWTSYPIHWKGKVPYKIWNTKWNCNVLCCVVLRWDLKHKMMDIRSLFVYFQSTKIPHTLAHPNAYRKRRRREKAKMRTRVERERERDTHAYQEPWLQSHCFKISFVLVNLSSSTIFYKQKVLLVSACAARTF